MPTIQTYTIQFKNNFNPFLKIIALCILWLFKVKNSVCVCREFLTLNAYILNYSYQIWVRFIFVYQKPLKRKFKPFFEYKITFWICVFVLWIHILVIFSPKAGVKCLYKSFLVYKINYLSNLVHRCKNILI